MLGKKKPFYDTCKQHQDASAILKKKDQKRLQEEIYKRSMNKA